MTESGPSGADVREVDVVVVGGGPAGEVVAGRCADRGLDTVLVERELVGGECSYWGCIPSKTLVRPGDVLAAARRVPGAAAAVRGPPAEAAALPRRNYMTAGWSDDGQERWLADHGVGLIRGSGRLGGPRRGTGDGGPAVSARPGFVLAPGSRTARCRARYRKQPGDPARSRLGRGPGGGQPLGDGRQGSARPAARPRWRGGRAGAGAGVPPARLRRGHRGRRRRASAPPGGVLRR